MFLRGVNKSLVLLALLSVMAVGRLYGQYVINGGTPALTRWMQLKGDTYKVIYPQGTDSLAKRYLWLLEQNNNAVMLGLGGITPAKLPVILYNTTANSNGMVVWAPKRMELYTLPVRSSYPIKWEEQLALHESRHVGQMTYFTKGIYKAASIFFGEQAPSIGVGLFGSRWLLEGDAVIAETELTNSGRGRNAEFMEYYRTAFLEGDTRNWDKWRRGSYKKYTPDVYAFGYLVNGTARYKSGKYEYAGNVLNRYVTKFYDFSGFKHAAGESYRTYLKQGRELMTEIWSQEQERRGTLTSAQQVLLHRKKGYVEYSSPVAIGKDSIIYIKYSFNQPRQLVLVHNGEEKVLSSISTSTDKLAYGNGMLYFAENISSPRWSNLVYRELYKQSVDALLGRRRAGERGGSVKLQGGTYYNSPQVSVGGDTLLVEEFFPQGGSCLVLVKGATGEVLQKIPAPSCGDVTESVFLGRSIYALAITGKGLGLYRWRLDNPDSWEEIIQEQSAYIGDLHSEEGYLYFVSDIDGVRNIYTFYPEAGLLKRVTNEKYGASEPYIYNGELYYSVLELGGKFPVKLSLADVQESGSEYDPELEGTVLKSKYRYVIAEELARQAKQALGEKGLLASQEEIAQRGGTSIVAYTETEAEFAERVEAKKYRKGGHLFKIHSWAPVYYDVDRILESDFDNLHQVMSLGATAYSQNSLGTAVSMFGYSYHNGFHGGHFKFKYSGLYPVLQLSADYNADQRYNVSVEMDSLGAKQVINEVSGALLQMKGVAYIPFKFNSHGWQRGVTPQVAVEYSNNGYYDNTKRKYLYATGVASALQMYVMRDIAHSGIFPKWGIGGVAKHQFVINGGENFGNVASMYLYGYLPGFAPMHGLKLSLGVQKQNVDGKNYYSGNLLDMPRGYKEDVYGENYFIATADYAFPVYLGDISLWRLAYLKRLQVIPFADYAVVKRGDPVVKNNLYSYGASLLVDLIPFSIGVECSVGVRYSYCGNNGDFPGSGSSVQLMFSTSL